MRRAPENPRGIDPKTWKPNEEKPGKNAPEVEKKRRIASKRPTLKMRHAQDDCVASPGVFARASRCGPGHPARAAAGAACPAASEEESVSVAGRRDHGRRHRDGGVRLHH